MHNNQWKAVSPDSVEPLDIFKHLGVIEGDSHDTIKAKVVAHAKRFGAYDARNDYDEITRQLVNDYFSSRKKARKEGLFK